MLHCLAKLTPSTGFVKVMSLSSQLSRPKHRLTDPSLCNGVSEFPHNKLPVTVTSWLVFPHGVSSVLQMRQLERPSSLVLYQISELQLCLSFSFFSFFFLLPSCFLLFLSSPLTPLTSFVLPQIPYPSLVCSFLLHYRFTIPFRPFLL
ncbi:hypothetical protein BJ508DRAFT_12409 [Ascobolus immersus RN42]|uniref:Uncharacterized protein n=1 Tax=Ascobolus immersus RN42 TaxID=1160509 RepID=A0A3N4HRT4_ASCIM|nr:hypothetical protein BJ508DRAFT_12409 [Ascobolus immersus RN42]